MQITIKHITLALLCCVATVARAQFNTDRITAIGRNALYYEDYVLSIQYFNQVIKLKPYLAEPYLYRAIAKIQLGDYASAERDCNDAIHNNPFSPGAYYTRGFIYRQTERFDLSEKDFTEALVFAPENKTYLLLRADVRAQKKDYTGALQDIDYLLRKEPNSPSFHFEKGVVLMSSQDTLGALTAFSDAVRLEGTNPANWSAKGLVNSLLGNDDDALYDLTQAVNLGSKWAGDYINRGVLHYKRHNFRAALADYDKAIELNPQDARCYYNRGLIRQELGDFNRALDDYNQALSLAPDELEVHYQRGTVNLQLKQWKEAVADFDTLIANYPYFLPSYYLAARAKTELGERKAAFRYQQKADLLEKDKDKIQRQKQLDTDAQLAENQPRKKDPRKEFSNRAAQNRTDADSGDDSYRNEARGAVQHRYADITGEPNVTLSYYAPQTNASVGPQPNAFVHHASSFTHPLVDDYNRNGHLPAPLHATMRELPLSADMVSRHFDQIDLLSRQIDNLEQKGTPDSQDADTYFARAMEFAIVQDYTSAIEDLNKALALRPRFAIALFCRANWRYKYLEVLLQNGESGPAEQIQHDFDLILKDYDDVIFLRKDFAFAYYNKGNVLCSQQRFAEAIIAYTDAIRIERDFGEAYFNRGLTRIYNSPAKVGGTDAASNSYLAGLEDLSRAGELGIYQAYNLISRFK